MTWFIPPAVCGILMASARASMNYVNSKGINFCMLPNLQKCVHLY